METKITNMNELRAAVVSLTAKINDMCNVKTTEQVSEDFVCAKDLLISVFKFNVERTQV